MLSQKLFTGRKVPTTPCSYERVAIVRPPGFEKSMLRSGEVGGFTRRGYVALYALIYITGDCKVDVRYLLKTSCNSLYLNYFVVHAVAGKRIRSYVRTNIRSYSYTLSLIIECLATVGAVIALSTSIMHFLHYVVNM